MKKRLLNMFIGVLIVTVAIGGCSKASTYLKGEVNSKATYNQENSKVEMDTTKSINKMGISLFKGIANENKIENLVFSPVGVSFALAMLQNGADGETKNEIMSVMEENDININSRFNSLMNHYNALDTGEVKEDSAPGIKLSIANSLWVRKPLEPKQTFVDTLKSEYNAQVFSVDFASPDTISSMNQWIEEQTNHLLKDTIKEISDETIATLMNTIYFKGTWRNEFGEAATKKEPFQVSSDKTKNVDMMNTTDHYLYFEDDDYQIASLPYYGGARMLVLLPKKDTESFVENTSLDEMLQIIQGKSMTSKKLELSLPKFDYQTNIPLKDLLVSNGMEKAFSENEAEFQNLIELSNQNVFVSSIFQNARIKLDEKGTEAAAVTVIMVEATSAPIEDNPIVFNCNKPFVYFIMDDYSDTVLFVGLVREP